jgi:hypothetical protein
MYSPGLLLRGLKDLRRERKKARLLILLFNPIFTHRVVGAMSFDFINLNSKYYFNKKLTLLTLLCGYNSLAYTELSLWEVIVQYAV